MGFVWVALHECSTCGADATATERASDEFEFPVCRDCRRREARTRQ